METANTVQRARHGNEISFWFHAILYKAATSIGDLKTSITETSRKKTVVKTQLMKVGTLFIVKKPFKPTAVAYRH